MFYRVDSRVGGYSATSRVVGVACNLETSKVCLFNGNREQFLVKRNIRSTLRACSFIPACQRDLDQVRAFLNLSPNGISQLSGLAEVSDERNVSAAVGDPLSRCADVRSAYLTGS